MTHAINLLERQVSENKNRLRRLDSLKEEHIAGLVVVQQDIKDLKHLTDSMESELKSEYGKFYSQQNAKDNYSVGPGPDKQVTVSMNKVPGEKTYTEQTKL